MQDSQSESVRRREGLLSVRCGQQVLGSHRKRTVFGYGSLPEPAHGRRSGGKGLGITRLCQHHSVEIECESCVILHFPRVTLKKIISRNSLAVQWLGLCAFTAKGPGSTPGWGTKILHATRPKQTQVRLILIISTLFRYLDVQNNINSTCNVF